MDPSRMVFDLTSPSPGPSSLPLGELTSGELMRVALKSKNQGVLLFFLYENSLSPQRAKGQKCIWVKSQASTGSAKSQPN